MENLTYTNPIMKNTNAYRPIIATAIQDTSWGVKRKGWASVYWRN